MVTNSSLTDKHWENALPAIHLGFASFNITFNTSRLQDYSLYTQLHLKPFIEPMCKQVVVARFPYRYYGVGSKFLMSDSDVIRLKSSGDGFQRN